MLPHMVPFKAEHFYRERLARWCDGRVLPCSQDVRRSINFLRTLQRYATPRVFSAALHTVLNSWCTARRMKEEDKGCRFKCRDTAADSLEHYSRCPVLRTFAVDKLGLPPETVTGMSCWAGMSADDAHDIQIVKGVLLYTAFRTFNTARHAALPMDTAAINYTLDHFLHKALDRSTQANAALLASTRRARHRAAGLPEGVGTMEDTSSSALSLPMRRGSDDNNAGGARRRRRVA